MNRTIVFIHGTYGTGAVWEKYKRHFEDRGYTCLTPTLRYHDVDPKAAPRPQLGTTSLLDYAADLEADIRKLNAKPILIGHSMGGLLAQMLAARTGAGGDSAHAHIALGYPGHPLLGVEGLMEPTHALGVLAQALLPDV